MIKDLKEFGQWLEENDLVSFNNINEDDYIFIIAYENDRFYFKNIQKASDNSFGYYNKSLFNKELQFSSNQNYVIADNKNLMGMSPFFVIIGDIQKFKVKSKRSMDTNSNRKQFVEKISEIYDNFDNGFLDRCSLTFEQKNELKILYDSINLDNITDLIIKFYSFIYENSDNIIEKIKSFENYKDITFYLACIFGDEKDLINDLFFNYCKYLKKTSENVDDYKNGICSICNNNVTVYPSFPGFFSNKPNYFFNNDSNIKNSPLQICNHCNSYINFAIQKLMDITNFPNILIIPKERVDGGYLKFIKISNKETNSFEKLNDFLKYCEEFNFDLIIYRRKNALMLINKYIENYNAFLLNFENLLLFNNNQMNYILHDSVYSKSYKRALENTFDFEILFKDLFIYIKDDKFKKFNQPFYKMYTKDKKGIGNLLKYFNSKSKSIFLKYYNNIFEFVYEINFNAINKSIISEIVLNCLIVIQKNNKFIKNYNFEILKRLNFYFLFINGFLGGNLLLKENVITLKESIKDLYGPKDINNEIIIELIDNEPCLKYFILGQFIRVIDNYKEDAGKNVNIFSNFISHTNKNNIKKYFTIQVLQKNNFYINQFTEKEKFIFEILKLYGDILFDEKVLSFEDYLLSIFTGYYCENIISDK